MSQSSDSMNTTPVNEEALNTVEKVITTGEKHKNGVDNAIEDRILKRGDLARIEQSSAKNRTKLKNYDMQLGRILRAIPREPDESSSHPFIYDIELMLGGKVSGVERADLKYTTASDEGMCDDSKRKRKPNTLLDYSPERNKPQKSKTTKTKAGTKKQKKETGSKTSKKTTTKTGKKGSTKKTAKKRPASSNSTTKAKKAKLSKTTTSTTVKESPTPPTSGEDMYERHRKEFERSFKRLKKVDLYHWFLGEVPKEFDECYVTKSSLPDTEKDGATKQEDESSTSNEGAKPKEPISNSTETADSSKEVQCKFPNHPPYNFHILEKRMEHGKYLLDRKALETEERARLMQSYLVSIGPKRKKRSILPVLCPKAVDWESFRMDVIGMCDTAVLRNMECDDGSAGTISHVCKKIKELMEQIYETVGQRQNVEIASTNDRHRFFSAIESFDNKEAAMQGRWRKDAFPYRQYERLKTDVVCAGLSEVDEKIASYELRTTLKDSFVGLAYTFDDTEKSEAWMKSLLDEAGDLSQQRKVASALKADDGVIKAQVAATMQTLLIKVQDRVMTDLNVLKQKELRNANWEEETNELPQQILSTSLSVSSSGPEIVEQPVWGMDCYTRRNISICLETEFDSNTILTFIEKWLLPAINACPVDLAHDISNAARILEGLRFESDASIEKKGDTTEQWSKTLLGNALLNKISSSGPSWLRAAAHLLRKAYLSLGSDFFRIHPKGHGSIVLCPKLEPNRLVTFYRGELYPSWRWGEKMDAIASIQQRKGLKPVLPDFFNMALERPVIDPRGYGLLFCDASRKSGYGSMLSHSCEPSCEVRVTAVNGKLTLAMTTLREMTIGDELTFDYNAVTESLNEYQSAVCLCGHGRCRGSFLHFATADCYQQVLNRNSPVAVRLANLIKGCMKRVMSEDDEIILKRHGFQTAAFGAVSVNRRQATKSSDANMQLDSMDFVPIWLRTYVADTLRYIEYERRALPIALICNSLFSPEGENKGPDKVKKSKGPDKVKKEHRNSDKDDKPIKGAKPEPSFFYFSRVKREDFISILMKQNDKQTLSGSDLIREVQKVASAHWKDLGEDAKLKWKEKAVEEWRKNGGKKKAKLEEERLARKSKTKSSKDGSKGKKKASKMEEELKTKISFRDADAEGVSAMEQRIQQLTQTLSRVGRVLDRHREAVFCQRQEPSSLSPSEVIDTALLRNLVHAPLSIMKDEHVVAWMWNHENGIVQLLLKYVMDEACVSPSLKDAMAATKSKFSVLEEYGTPWISGKDTGNFSLPPVEGRVKLNEALMEFRNNLLSGIDDMAKDLKRYRSLNRKEASNRKKILSDKVIIQSVMDNLLGAVEERITGKPFIASTIQSPMDDSEISKKAPSEIQKISEPWLQNFNKRFKLEKAADLLLMYAQTSTFFKLKAYQPLESSPIEVYARELGNAVPRSAIDISPSEESSQMDIDTLTKSPKKSKSSLCEPDDIIAKVAVRYQEDFILSQLLQWYNAGIDQKPGLPDLMGCVLLPSMKGFWDIDGTRESSSKANATGYKSLIRPRLIDWLQDPLKRGSPWPDDLRRAFVQKEDDKPIANASDEWIPLGSPVLDFLVTGEDVNIRSILDTIGDIKSGEESKTSDNGLLSSVDHGRPAQAVSNWVQCENPDCMKWRKVPWHVDVDMLSEKFYCKDNVWNPKAASCDSPEEEWDATIDGVVDADGSAPVAVDFTPPASPKPNRVAPSIKMADFNLGDKFDVIRSGNEKWTVATVVEIKVEGGKKKVKFHFLKNQEKNDEWLEVDSPRIAELYTKTPRPIKKASTKGKESRKKPKATKKAALVETKKANQINLEIDTTVEDDERQIAGTSSTSNGQENSKEENESFSDKAVKSLTQPNTITDESSHDDPPPNGAKQIAKVKSDKDTLNQSIPRKSSPQIRRKEIVYTEEASSPSKGSGASSSPNSKSTMRIPRKVRSNESGSLIQPQSMPINTSQAVSLGSRPFNSSLHKKDGNIGYTPLLSRKDTNGKYPNGQLMTAQDGDSRHDATQEDGVRRFSSSGSKDSPSNRLKAYHRSNDSDYYRINASQKNGAYHSPRDKKRAFDKPTHKNQFHQSGGRSHNNSNVPYHYDDRRVQGQNYQKSDSQQHSSSYRKNSTYNEDSYENARPRWRDIPKTNDTYEGSSPSRKSMLQNARYDDERPSPRYGDESYGRDYYSRPSHSDGRERLRESQYDYQRDRRREDSRSWRKDERDYEIPHRMPTSDDRDYNQVSKKYYRDEEHRGSRDGYRREMPRDERYSRHDGGYRDRR